MGLSGGSKTTTSTTKPVYEGQILGGVNAYTDAYNNNRANVADIQSRLSGLLSTAVGNYNNNPSMNAAKGYAIDTISRPYTSSEYLDPMLAISNRNVANQTTASLGTRGLTGGSQMAKILAGRLAENDTALRYQDYNNWQDRRAQAASLTPALASADNANLSGVLGLSDAAANLTTDNAARYAGTIGSILGQYINGKQVEKTSSGFGAILGSLLSSAAQGAGAAAAASDVRLKENIRRVGQTDGGLPVYTYNYIGDPTPMMGVMAQEVARLQPEALGPVIEGFGTVKYGEVR
jgi:hypothetical protein